MLAEIESISTRVDCIKNEIIKPMLCDKMMLTSHDDEPVIETRDQKSRAIIAELNSYKVRFENILCETDIKEQAHSN